MDGILLWPRTILTTDPGWVNCTYTRPVEFLRVNLGGEHSISHVAYEPRVMGPSPSDGTWNGVYKNYAIYVTDSASDNQADWGNPVATGTWTWPNLQERKDVTFTPKSGRYVYFARLSGYGWFTEQGYPGYAGANEIRVYEQGGGGSGGSLVHSFYHADGNGNVTCMVDGGLSIVGSYKYDPYGRTISSSGNNNYQFSSKEFLLYSGMYYYLYRFYDPNTQRWLNRDPIQEYGSYNLYKFVGNDAVNGVDPYGLVKIYGNWCGPDWTGGRKEEFTPHPPGYYKPPVDALDSACMIHDRCYYNCRATSPCNPSQRSQCFRNCDRALTKAAYAFGGFWGRVIGAAIDRPGTRDPGPNATPCGCPQVSQPNRPTTPEPPPPYEG